MKVTLIYPGIVGIGFNSLGKGGMDCNWINLGLAYIGAYLKSESHQVDLIDLRAMRNWNEVEAEIARRDSDVFGVYFNTPNFNNALACCAVAKRLKKMVVAGGPHATVDPDNLISTGQVDYVITGEGEVSFAELLKDLEEGNDVQKIIKGKTVENLDDLPFPDRDLYDMPKLLNPFKGFPFMDNGTVIFSSRGCAFDCSFCQPLGRKMFGKVVRYRSAENVIKELEHVVSKYKVRYISFQDDTLTLRKGWVLDLCRRIKERKIPIQWSAQSRVDLFDEELARTMKDAGCVCIFFGFESGSQRILDFLRKGITVEQSLKAARLCRAHGMLMFADHMIGVPTETEDDLKMSLEFIKKVRPELPALTYFTPIPGCELYDYCKERDLITIKAYEDFTRNPSGLKIRGINYALLKKYKDRMAGYTPRWYEEWHYARLAFARWASLIKMGHIGYFLREFYNVTVTAHFGIVTSVKKVFRILRYVATKKNWADIRRTALDMLSNILAPVTATLSGYSFVGPRAVGIEPTNRCNLSCIMCARQAWDKDANQLGDMPLELFNNNILPFLTSSQTVILHGFGEPLIGKEFLEMVRACKRKGLRVVFTTNGLMLKKYAHDLLEIGVDLIGISIDGVDALKKIRGVEISAIIDNIRAIQELKCEMRKELPELRINFVVMKDNVEDLPDLVNFAHELNIKEIIAVHVVMHYDAMLDQNILRYIDIAKKYFDEARHRASELDIKLNLPPLQKSFNNCCQPFRMVYINWNGDVRPCCIATINEKDTLKLGNVNEVPLSKLWNSRMMRRLRVSLFKNKKLMPFCENCSLHICSLESHTRIL